ncbi:MAG: hypothetical protein RML57_06785 [Acidobacteriota bacterium]|nr:hypothetical protein [Acidobacteriota bacterium]
MTTLLHGVGLRLGLVTNGEHWRLVPAPRGETAGLASWYAMLWLEEPLTLRAFRSLLRARRFFGVPDDETLEALLAKSAARQQDVTDQLGDQVRRAVEVLVRALDRADQDAGRRLLVGVTPEDVYAAALTVMMRLVFLFCAEERELIPGRPFPLYEEHYAVSTLSEQLRAAADRHGEALLERRYDAWLRLPAAFRATYGGIQREAASMPAYGGGLFDPDRFPFLEGRPPGSSWRAHPAEPPPISNRAVLHMLEALQFLETSVPGRCERSLQRVSFRALDIEQIGHVYEGLLEHTARRAAEPYLGLVGTGQRAPVVPPATLETWRTKGEEELIEFLKDATGRSDSALRKALTVTLDLPTITRFRTACHGDDALWRRVTPLAGLVRFDGFGCPVALPMGASSSRPTPTGGRAARTTRRAV